jgi:hypothetical protein
MSKQRRRIVNDEFILALIGRKAYLQTNPTYKPGCWVGENYTFGGYGYRENTRRFIHRIFMDESVNIVYSRPDDQFCREFLPHCGFELKDKITGRIRWTKI